MQQPLPASDRDLENRGEIGFDYAFRLHLTYEGPHETETPHGTRIFKKITGGTISGRINGTVYPRGAGEYSLGRGDGVVDVNGHVLIRADNGEWLYLRNLGYDRPDGYFRVTSWVDADLRGEHVWVLGLFFVGTGVENEAGDEATITYYEVL